jgi:hypothetical protein
VEHKRPVRPERPDERRREQGIGQVLGVVEALSLGPIDALEEKAQGAGGEVLVVADQVEGRPFQVSVESQALGHGVVGGLIAGQEAHDALGRGVVDHRHVQEKGDSQEEEGH